MYNSGIHAGTSRGECEQALATLMSGLSDISYFSIRHRGYYLFHCSFYAATIQGRRLFLGDINNGWIEYEWVRWWQLLDTVSSTRSLSVLLWAVGMAQTTQTILALACAWLSSEIIHTCACVRATFTSCGYYLRLVLISFKSFGLCNYYSRAATIWGRRLFQEIR